MFFIQLFLPFAAGFFLSYIYRTANAVIAPLIGQELGLGDGALGFLTSAYFLIFGLAQLPVGILLDRYGPRRVESALLVVAAIGALMYGTAHDLLTLTLGRAVIGLGVSACLMGPLKAFAMSCPKHHLASRTSWIMAAGGLGAIAAAVPLEYLLGSCGWREVCIGGAVVTLFVAALVYFVVPESRPSDGVMHAKVSLNQQVREIRVIFQSPQFWRFAPICFLFAGGFQALQGLWAGRWIAVQGGGDKMAVAAQLTSMNIAVLAGMMCMGAFATRLIARGIKLENLYFRTMLIACLALGFMVCWPLFGSVLLWPLLGLCFSLNNVAYTQFSQSFPPAFAGRANSAMNMLVLAGAFSLQWGLGALVDLFRFCGADLVSAYQCSFGLLVVSQLMAWSWFGLPRLSVSHQRRHVARERLFMRQMPVPV